MFSPLLHSPPGAHPSGTLGEDPRGIPNCLMPYVLQVLVGRRDVLTVHGADYPTPDGTPIRDYIHVMDVAAGHVDALAWMKRTHVGGGDANAVASNLDVFNFGTGRGVSVFQLVAALEKAAGKKVPVVVGPRRPGDLPQSYCAPGKAAATFGWTAKYDLDAICVDAWRWQSSNPKGYDT